MAGSTSAITLSSAADSVPNEETSARCSRPTVFSAAAMTSAGDASRSARSSDCACETIAASGGQHLLRGRAHWPALSEWRNCIRRLQRGDAAVAGRLVEHRVALHGRGERIGVGVLLHLEGVEAGARHEHELVAQHLAGGAQFAVDSRGARAAGAPGCRRGRRGNSGTPARQRRAGRDMARDRRRSRLFGQITPTLPARFSTASGSSRKRAAGTRIAPSPGNSAPSTDVNEQIGGDPTAA